MKKYFLLFFISLSFYAVQAQTDSLKQYIGVYSFPEGSPVTEITLVIENDLLMGKSSVGNAEFRKKENDVFEIIGFSGTANFRRNTEGKIIGVLIDAGGNLMEGIKNETPE